MAFHPGGEAPLQCYVLTVEASRRCQTMVWGYICPTETMLHLAPPNPQIVAALSLNRCDENVVALLQVIDKKEGSSPNDPNSYVLRNLLKMPGNAALEPSRL